MKKTVIYSQKLEKKFTSYKKKPGLLGSLKSLFVRDYITKKAVKDFELDIKKGEIIGLLGPNGAGKTTLMKMFTGIVVPSQGTLKVLGYTPSERNKLFRKKIALVMGQKSQLWWDIPAMDSFLLLQRFYEIEETQFEKRIKTMSTLLDVEDLLHIHVRKLSLGERMKMELMASLIHSPEIIFLDEPTIGLDLISQENIRNFIKEYHQKNECTIIVTSHYMADVQALCERLVLIFDGDKTFDGPLSDFETILGKEKNVTFNFSSPQNTNLEVWKSYEAKWDPHHVQVDLRIPEEKLRSVALDILKEFPVTEFNTEKMPIERVMKTLMKNPQIVKQLNGKNGANVGSISKERE